VSWQEIWFGCAGFLYFAVLWPAILNPSTEMPRRGSLMTACLMTGSGIAYGSLGMPVATVMMLLGASQWLFLAVYRPIRSAPATTRSWETPRSPEHQRRLAELAGPDTPHRQCRSRVA